MAVNSPERMISQNGASPIFPFPMWSWRSTREPSAVLESFKCQAARRSRPMIRSNFWTISQNPFAVAISNPAANRCAVSRHVARRSGAFERSMMVASCSNVWPSEVPWPAVISSAIRHLLPEHEAKTASRLDTIRVKPVSSPSPMCAPGWSTRNGRPS